MKLYSYFRSSAAFRVRIALNLKKIAYEQVPIHLVKEGGIQHSASYKTLNPQELVPALEHDGHIINQSLAIIEYLDECFPTPALLPTDRYLRAQARGVALYIACDIHPLNNLRVLNYLTQDLEVNADQKTGWYHHWITTGFAALENQLSAIKEPGIYSFGNMPTIADIFLIPQLANARRFEVDLTPYPRLIAIEQACLSHPAFIKALPANQPDAE